MPEIRLNQKMPLEIWQSVGKMHTRLWKKILISYQHSVFYVYRFGSGLCLESHISVCVCRSTYNTTAISIVSGLDEKMIRRHKVNSQKSILELQVHERARDILILITQSSRIPLSEH